MKKLDLIIAFCGLMIFTSCGFEVKNEGEIIKLERSEIYGSWVQTKALENSRESDEVLIKKINFKKDLTAEIEISDSSGDKTIIGEWTDKEEKVDLKAIHVSFDQGILLTFWQNDSTLYSNIILSTKEINNKKYLISFHEKFEKE